MDAKAGVGKSVFKFDLEACATTQTNNVEAPLGAGFIWKWFIRATGDGFFFGLPVHKK